jgi:acyl carrier protein
VNQPIPQAVPEQIDPNRVLAVVATVAREARPHVEAQVTLDSALERELGLDSLARVELVLRLEREFAASLPEQALASSETPRDLLRFVLASAGQAAASADRTVASLVQSEGIRPPEHAQTRAARRGAHGGAPGANDTNERRRAPARARADAHRGARVLRRAPARAPDDLSL